jgi:Protein of unknown function (DUF2752)
MRTPTGASNAFSRVGARMPDRFRAASQSRYRTRLLAPAGALAAAVAAVTFITTVDPNEAGHYPTCPFLALTGWQCPGCGTLRMIHALTHGHLGTALSFNPLSFVSLPILCIGWVRWTAALVGGRPVRRLAKPTPIWALLGIVILFWIGRNLTSAW